jgi:hypothetical protein
MSEAHWIGEYGAHGDADIEWCITCDKKAELLDCEQCGEACCHNCSEGTDTGIICRCCYEGGDE